MNVRFLPVEQNFGPRDLLSSASYST